MKKKLIVHQDGYKECGAASLLSIIRYYDGNININKIVELTNTTKEGTNFYNLKEAAEAIGLEAIGYQVDIFDKLFEITPPFISQIIDNNYEHFIVVYKIKKDKLICMDPARGVVSINIEKFKKIWTSYIMIFQPKKELPYYNEEKYLNKIIKEIIKNNKSIVLNITILSTIFTIVSCITSLYIQIMLDNSTVIYNNYYLIITFCFMLILIIKTTSSFFRNELLIFLNQKLDLKIFMQTFKKLLLLPYNYYKNKTSGEIISRINDLAYVKGIINKIILTVFLDITIFIISGLILFIINKVLFIFLILVILIYIIIYRIFRPLIKDYTNINQINNSIINSYLVETISGFETIKNINIIDIIYNKMEERYIKALNDSFIYDNYSNLEIFLKNITSSIGLLLIEFIGLTLYMNNRLNLGSLLSFIFISSLFIESIKNIIDLSKEYYYAINSIKRINNLFNVESERLSTKQNLILKGNINLNNLSFSYNNNNKVLENININIKAGEKILIIGTSGSGKSTIIKLLQKHYSIKRNSIYLDEIDINDYSLKDIRDNISTISQNEILFTDTIYNNITMFKNITNKEFKEICKITNLDEFTKDMFLGYNTKLEENGLNLSGGQRQRIILARMLLQNNNIMLIDEGLNAIDINLERIILKNIFNKYKNNTIIIISHRLENMDLFNKVVRLEKGRILNCYQKPGGDFI